MTANAPLDVFNHNLETLHQLYRAVRPGSDFEWSMDLLAGFNARVPQVPTKSGLMLGLAETDEEVMERMRVDTWPDSFGQKYGHGSVFYNAIREGLVDPRHFVQIGIRSPIQPEVMRWTLEQGVTILSAQGVHEIGVAGVVERIRDCIGTEEPVYLSFDIDALDPSFAPGTGTPEIGGLASWQVQAILRGLRGLNFVGMDLVEVALSYDHAELTSLAAATLVWEYLCLQGPVLSPEF